MSSLSAPNTDSSVTAVIPVHNRADLLARLLDSMQNQTRAFTETIVVDNASSDEALTVAQKAGCRIIEMGENAGFARAVNRGCQGASGEWIAILNSDVELAPDWLETLLEAASHASFATGLIFDARTRHSGQPAIDGTYDLVSRAGCAWRAGHGASARAALSGSGPKSISIAPATACIFRRKVLEQLGGLDEAYGSYLEDVDLGLRCIQRGFTGVYVPDAIAWHEGSATFGRWSPLVVRLISRNQLLLVSRHYDSALLRSCFWPILVGQLLWGLLALRHGAALAWAAGKWDGLRRFRVRGTDSAALRDFLAASEHEIEARANETYWRWYFRLTPKGRRP